MTEAAVASFIDTNVLVQIANPEEPFHLSAAKALQKLYDTSCELYISPQICAEFWNVCTRPRRANGYALSIDETSRHLDRFSLLMGMLFDDARQFDLWRDLIRNYKVSGVKVHDARIAALLQVHQIPNLLTFNGRDFRRYPGITVIDPRELA